MIIARFFFFASSLILCTGISCHEAQGHGAEVRISGVHLRACEVALVEFRNLGLELEKYSIIVRELESETEVVLLPNRAAHERFNKGGRTSNGPEIHYFVSPQGKLKRSNFAR